MALPPYSAYRSSFCVVELTPSAVTFGEVDPDYKEKA
jgi:hypothetical protein